MAATWVPRNQIARAPNSIVRKTGPALVPLLLLIYWPNAELIHELWPQRLFGFSLWVTVIPTFVTLTFFMLRAGFTRILRGALTLLGVLLILLARDQWGLNDDDRGFLRELAALRYVVLLPVLIWISKVASEDSRFRRWAPVVMAANGTIACVVAITYALGMHQFRVAPALDDYYLLDIQSRAAGLMGGTNVFANTVVASVLALHGIYKPLSYLLAPVLLLGVVASQSRLALLSAVSLFVAASRRMHTPRQSFVSRSMPLFAVIAIVWIGATVTDDISKIRGRFGEAFSVETEARLDKYQLGLSAWASNISTIMFGAKDTGLVVGERAVDTFSDNSLISALSSGGLFCGAVIVIEIFIAARVMVSSGQIAAPTVIIATLLFNNAVLWDVWLYLIFSAAFLQLHNLDIHRKPKTAVVLHRTAIAG